MCESTRWAPGISVVSFSSILAIIIAACPIRVEAEAPQPIPLKITFTVTSSITSGTVPAGKPVTLTWKIDNTGTRNLNGSLIFYLNNQPIGSLANPANGTMAPPGKTTAGTETFNPIPGVNVISAIYLSVSVGTLGNQKPPKLTDLQIGKTPTNTGATGDTTVPPNAFTVLAEGVIQIYASPTVLVFNDPTNRQQLMSDYAPLLLNSYDHGSDETYAPIGVTAFIDGSDLVSQNSAVGNMVNAQLQNNERGILSPPSVPPSTPPTPDLGAITAQQEQLPAQLYLQPTQTSTVAAGDSWSDVMSAHPHNVGLYGHVSFIDPAHFQSDADLTLPARIYKRYNCPFTTSTVTGISTLTGPCPAQIIKIEYWQFFGYSYDFQASTGIPAVDDFLTGAGKKYIDHVGDWCSVQVFIDASWWKSPDPAEAILAVYHYVHGKQIGFDMAQVSDGPIQITVPTRGTGFPAGPQYAAKEFRGPSYPQDVEYPISYDGFTYPPSPGVTAEVGYAQNNIVQLAAIAYTPSYSHPVVYVEWGGHEFWPTASWGYTGASKHNGAGSYSYFASTPLDLVVGPPTKVTRGTSPTVISPEVQLVTSFAGYWGTKSDGGPPPGPPLHTEWYWDPILTPSDLFQTIETKQRPNPNYPPATVPLTTRVY